jgi:opacity protein-like surface antigen
MWIKRPFIFWECVLMPTLGLKNRVHKFWIVGAFFVLAMLGMTSSYAQGLGDGTYYIGMRGIGAYGMMDDITNAGFTGAREDRNTEDPTAGFGLVFGYSMPTTPIRLEVEIAHRFRMDFDLRDIGPPVVGFENNVDSQQALVNALWEIRNKSNWTPYLGGSIGWSRNNSEIERTPATGAITKTSNATNNLALGVMVGTSWYFSEHWGLDMGYRYLNLGEVDSGSLSGGESFKVDNYVTHDVLFSVNYRF